MCYEIFLFELKYRLRRADTYLFFFAILLFSIIAVNFIYEGQEIGQIKLNSSFVVSKTMAICVGFFMIITSMIMGVPIIRDFRYNIQSLIFVNPISKLDYLLGRFAGSFVILILVFSALIWGMVLGDMMPWRDPERLLSFNLTIYFDAYLKVVIPSLFISGGIFFISGALSQKLMVVYTQGLVFFLILIFGLAIENPTISALLDPSGYSAISELTDAWEADHYNSSKIPLGGIFLLNRVIWIGIAVVVLFYGRQKFKFSTTKESKQRPLKVEDHEETNNEYNHLSYSPEFNFRMSLNQLQSQVHFTLLSIFKEWSFWAIVATGVISVLVNSFNIETDYGVDSYPATYLIVDEIKEMSIFFFLLILITFSGELIWRERDLDFDLIYDALPVSSTTSLAGKFIGLLLSYLVLLSSLCAVGILFQVALGYYQFDLMVYFMGVFVEILIFLIHFSVISFLVQSLVNKKFVGHTLTFLFFIVIMAFGIFNIGPKMFQYGSVGLDMYSEMNGYGGSVFPYFIYKFYWLSLGFILFLFSAKLLARGKESSIRRRIKIALQNSTSKTKRTTLCSITLFLVSASYIFYNTYILNTYYSRSTQEQFRAEYERALKPFERLYHPEISDIDLTIDLHPEDRMYFISGSYILVNKSEKPIKDIHVQKYIDEGEIIDTLFLDQNFKIDQTYEKFGHTIYKLEKALLPNEQLHLYFEQSYVSKGFENGGGTSHITGNGTFFTNERLPTVGYVNDYELEDVKSRILYGLEKQKHAASRSDSLALQMTRSNDRGGNIDLKIVISTPVDQTAIVPGRLVHQWIKDDRKYFQYVSDSPMINFFSITSADYEIEKSKWKNDDSGQSEVDLEIYYHKAHAHNVDNMMNGMKKSLDYFSLHFSSYQYAQLKLVEVPRYRSFAQSLPGTITYSEDLGFTMDIREAGVLDMPFFITAHEVAHQWWGMQLAAANVRGRDFILETLAQYSALMVFKKEYGLEKTNQLLKFEVNRYLNGRKADQEDEIALKGSDSKPYIHYSKGIVNMNAFQGLIGEKNVNQALKTFLQEWRFIDGEKIQSRYPTSEDLLLHFKRVTPDRVRHIVEDLFGRVTSWDLSLGHIDIQDKESQRYQSSIEIQVKKWQSKSLIKSKDIWIDVLIKSNDGQKDIQKYKLENGVNSINIITSWRPSSIQIDPNLIYLDKNLENNLVEY